LKIKIIFLCTIFFLLQHCNKANIFGNLDISDKNNLLPVDKDTPIKEDQIDLTPVAPDSPEDKLFVGFHKGKQKIFSINSKHVVKLSAIIPEGKLFLSGIFTNAKTLIMLKSLKSSADAGSIYELLLQNNVPKLLLREDLKNYTNANYINNNDDQIILSAFKQDAGQEILLLNRDMSFSNYIDVNKESLSSYPTSGEFSGNNFYFSAFSSSAGEELWVLKSGGMASVASDGVPLVKSGSPGFFLGFDNKLYFTFKIGGTQNSPIEMVAHNSSTNQVENLPSSNMKSNPHFLTKLNNLFVSSCYSADKGREFCTLEENATQWNIQDLNSGVSNSSPFSFFEYENRLYFQASLKNSGSELFSFDGAKTDIVSELIKGEEGSYPENFWESNGGLFFSAYSDVEEMKVLHLKNADKISIIKFNNANISYSEPLTKIN